MTEELRITAMGHRGEGIATSDRGPIFVPYALPGETVRTSRKDDAARRLPTEILVSSSERVAAPCRHFGRCGGCAVQHWRADRVLEWKRGLVTTALAQAGLEAPVDATVDAHGSGRRRIVAHARALPNGETVVGFAELRSHSVVGIEACPLLAPELGDALAAARDIAVAVFRLNGGAKPLDLHVTATDAGLDIDVRGSGPLGPATTAALLPLAERYRIARLTRHGELLLQRSPPSVRIGRAQVLLPAGSFLQPTAAGEEALARLVCAHTASASPVLDLFSGVGPFALRLAEQAAVRAVDSSEPAVRALARAASNTAGLKPITTEVRDLFRRPLTQDELKPYAAVVFDPPRQGAMAQAEALARSRVPLIIAVSCQPGTFARDAAILVRGGYELTRVTPVDQFRYAAHVEVVGRFERKRERRTRPQR